MEYQTGETKVCGTITVNYKFTDSFSKNSDKEYVENYIRNHPTEFLQDLDEVVDVDVIIYDEDEEEEE